MELREEAKHQTKLSSSLQDSLALSKRPKCTRQRLCQVPPTAYMTRQPNTWQSWVCRVFFIVHSAKPLPSADWTVGKKKATKTANWQWRGSAECVTGTHSAGPGHLEKWNKKRPTRLRCSGGLSAAQKGTIPRSTSLYVRKHNAERSHVQMSWKADDPQMGSGQSAG